MIQTLIKNWWLVGLRGALAAVFSLMTFLMLISVESFTLRPFALKGMTVFLGIMALTAGACTAAAGIWSSGKSKWWLLLLDGLAVAMAGVIFIMAEGISFRVVTYSVLILAAAIGILELATARTLRRHVPDEWFLGLAGLASVGFVVAFLLVRSESAGATFVWLGCYSGFSAICMLGLALRLRGLRTSIHRMAQNASQKI